LNALEGQFSADVIVFVYSSLEVEDNISQAMLGQYDKLARLLSEKLKDK
jgi:hypothetical protein